MKISNYKPKNLNKPFYQPIKDYFDPKKVKTTPHIEKRAVSMGCIFFTFLIFILLRYAWIGVFPTPLRQDLVDLGNRQFETTVTFSQPRATITDRNGKVLAVSVPRPSVFLLPKRMPENAQIIQLVSKQIGIPFKELMSYQNDKRNFIWLKRQIAPKEFQAMGSLKKWRNFIGIVDEPKRIYPEGNIASHLIGFVGIDNNGLEGIEKIYNDRLKNIESKADVMRDAKGRLVIVKPNNASKPTQMANDLKLSIDFSIQQFTQKALKEGVKSSKAKGGSAIVMDVKTGEILSIASYPTYNLNNPTQSPNERRFRPVMDAIELGSVVKPMIVAKALDLGVIHKNQKINVENGKLALPGGTIHDTKPKSLLTPEEILKFSSNIGMYKIVQKLGRDEFFKLLVQVGFGRPPGTGLPGEWKGRISKSDSWREMRFANMAFGQGFAISPLQLIHALSIIVGGGTDHGVSLLALDKNQLTKTSGPQLQFISSKTSKDIAKMMGNIIEEGKTAHIPGILVGGKTGTAQIWNNKEKSYSGRTAVFEGIFPADNPKLAIVVVIDEVGVRPASGSRHAAPVFVDIGKQTLRYLNSKGVLNVKPFENAYKEISKNLTQN